VVTYVLTARLPQLPSELGRHRRAVSDTALARSI
jgi:hypothetical protein